MSDITIKQGEAKTITLTESTAMDLSTASFDVTLKTMPRVTRSNDEITKDNAASGEISFTLLATETELLKVGVYELILRTVFGSSNIDKASFSFEVEPG